nr:hypothetical protein Itr_chr10CG00920 [Ipomoea trifida]
MVGSSAKEAGRTKTSKPTKRSKQPDSRSRGLCILWPIEKRRQPTRDGTESMGSQQDYCRSSMSRSIVMSSRWDGRVWTEWSEESRSVEE